MSTEDEIDIPDAWRRAVHPRRSGMAALDEPRTDEPGVFEMAARRAGRGVDLDVERERIILNHPDSDRKAVQLARSGEPSVAADGVRLALAPNPNRETFWYSRSLAPINDLIAARGLVHAAAAFVESCAYHVPPSRSVGSSLLVRFTEATDTRDLWGGAAMFLRKALVAAPPEVYDEAVAALKPFRGGLTRQRIATSYLMPDRPQWMAEDLAALNRNYQGPAAWLFYSASTVEQLSRWRADHLGQFVTAYDAVGAEVAPLLVRWLTQWPWSPETRSDLLDVLSRIPTDTAFHGMLHRLGLPDVPGAVCAAGDRFPRRAARILAAHRDDEFAEVLFRRQVRRHPDVPEAGLVTRKPDAPAPAVPKLLASPPWTRKPPARVTIAPSPLATAPRMVWRDGEQERWAYDWRAFRAEDMRQHLPLAEKGTAPSEFYISGPEEIVRARLAEWKAESVSFYTEKPQVVVAKYGLEALPPMLRLARRKPAIGAGLLLPYLAVEVADLMAEWLTRSPRYRPIAREWFERHGADAAALLIPAALDASATAAIALSRVDADDVLAAADQLGCREAVLELLDRDPLDLVPAKIPAAPKWADPEYLPQVLLPGGERALPADAIKALLRMIAMSQLDAPYAGLRVIAEQCDPVSLAAFAWSLFRLWEAEGRPSKDAWAMNALGYFGDDAVADRLAPLVRVWPSEGAAPRAKRGADVLAAMNTDHALGQLSALARNAKSGPLRTHAAAALDRVAADRGLLPEQLDDLLAPDLGLDGDPVGYRDVSYSIELAAGELVLRDPAGHQIATLPKAKNDEEKAAVSAWNTQRRKAKAAIADQSARLEEAMIVQRRWTVDDFRSRLAPHPLLGRLARRLLWALDDRAVGLDELGDLVNPDGGLAASGTWVRLAHPAVDDFAPWAAWLARRGEQPFVQAGREVFLGEDPSAYWQRTVDAAALYGLVRRGWHWAAAGHQTLRSQLFRPFGAEGRVVLTIAPGTSAVKDAKGEPPQTIIQITCESSAHQLGVFGDLPQVTRSEVIRSLRVLD